MATKPLFEHVTCSRCCGTGSFSFNLMHGSKCYGCGGSGYKLTKRGSMAQAYLNDLRKVPVADVKVGDLIWFEMWGFRCCERVISIEQDTLNHGRVQIRAIRTKTGESVGLGAFPTSLVQRGASADEIKEMREKALAFQATLTKSGTVRKTRV